MHQKVIDKGQFKTEESHYPPFKLITSNKSKQHYQEKMTAIGNHAARFLLLAIEEPYHWLNTVRGILSLNKIYTTEIINQSCERAIAYSAFAL